MSLFRVGTVIAIIGVLLILGGIAAYFLDQNSYRVPLDVEPYPGAESWGAVREVGATRRLVFRIPSATPEDVANYYAQKLREFDASSTDSCQRVPISGELESAENDPSSVPYWYTCLFQRTGLRASQQTTITIQPGVFNPDPALNTEGMTVVAHSQRWQP